VAALRPSVFNRMARIGSQTESEPVIELEEAADGSVDVYFAQTVSRATATDALPEPAKRERILNVRPEQLTIWPINIRPDREDYLLPKYGSLTQFVLTQPVAGPYELPTTADDVVGLLEGLPEGFAKQFQFGLGLLWEYRFICEAVAEIPDITTLILHGGSDDAKIDPPFFILGMNRFRTTKKALASIAARYQRESRTDKRLLAYERLLHAADQKAFPQRIKKLRADAIVDMTKVGSERTTLSKRDQGVVVRLVNENAEELAKTEPQALFRLKSDIERVTLKELIATFEDMLTKKHGERKWQVFFEANPFILSMAFSVPAMLVESNPYVGGARFSGRGGKIADFLLATASTGNLAIIEIKMPSSALMTKTPYREDVHGPSAELGGTIAQVLDQRFRLQKDLVALKEESQRHDLQAYAIRCIVISGLTPQSIHERKSLELIRNSLTNVTIVTFDELLGRLKEIYNALSPNSVGPPSADHEVPF
jgi:hypothetical protein